MAHILLVWNFSFDKLNSHKQQRLSVQRTDCSPETISTINSMTVDVAFMQAVIIMQE